MKNKVFLSFLYLLSISITVINSQPIIINHNNTDISQLSTTAINTAKDNLHIAYGHTSHGSQLITGMNNLDAFMGGTGLYTWHDGPQAGALDIDDYFANGDLGHNGSTTWADETRDYLNQPENADVNVIIWSWCGGVSDNTEEGMQTYLTTMTTLETDYPNVKFVYMTGHLDGTGLGGNLHTRNEQIRDYCTTNNKILFDFADIETYDPDNAYFGDKIPNDNCDYDTDDNGSRDGNWATEWQNSHTQDTDWYGCSCAHSQALNCNRKAYAAWHLWTSIADIILPIETLVPLNANTTKYNRALLRWTTTNEINNKGFEIQRSNNGINWQKIGWIKGKNKTGNHQYTFNDKQPLDGNNYYRYKQFDLNGNHSFSNIVTITIRKLDIAIFPNPAKQTLSIKNKSKSPIRFIAISDQMGKQVLFTDYKNGTIDISLLPTGIYILETYFDATIIKKKLVIW